MSLDASDRVYEVEKPLPDIEDILAPVYENEKLLWSTFILVSAAGILTAFNVYSYQFLGATPDHWCQIEQFNNLNWTQDQIKQIAIPFTYKNGVQSFSSCHMYEMDYKSLAMLPYPEALEMSDHMKSANRTLECSKRTFSGDAHTFVTKWDLVCDRRPLYATTQSAVQSGFVVDAFFLGYLTDKYGRRRIFFISLVLCIACGLLLVVSPSIILFILLRMLSSTFGLAAVNAGLVLCLELSPIKRRSVIGAYFSLPWAFGVMLLPVIAYFIQNWYYLQLVTTAPFIILAVIIGSTQIVPESPRWLILNGRPDEARDTLLGIAKTPHQSASMTADLHLISIKGSPKRDNDDDLRRKLFRVLKTLASFVTRPELRLKSFVVWFVWFAASMTYYGVGLGAETINADEYWFIFWGGLSELTALLCLWPLSILMSRKKSLITFFTGGAITTFSVMFIIIFEGDHDLTTCKVALYLVGKFCVTCTFQLIWIFTSELYPTSLRCLACGGGSSVAKVASLFSPFVNDILGKKFLWAPSAIFGVFSLAAAASILLLPETGAGSLTEDEEEEEERVHESTAHSTETLGLSI